MLRREFGFIALLASALVAAGCGGRTLNGAGMVPTLASAAKPANPHAPMSATLALRIPPKPPANRPRYISPGTESLAVIVVPSAKAGASPTPMPVQILNVKSPACYPLPDADDLPVYCNFQVRVMPGSDSFSLTAYSSLDAKGSALSTYRSPGAIAIPSSGALAFTLEGIVDHVVMSFGSVQTLPVPIGVATSFPMTVVPYDARGFQILSQMTTGGYVPYDNAFTVDIAPASEGVTLSNRRGTGSMLTYKGPADLTTTVAYDGVARFDGTALTDTSFSLSAGVAGTPLVRVHPHPVGPTPTPSPTPFPDAAHIELASNAVPYVVATPPPTAGPNFLGGIAYSSQQKAFYYALLDGASRIGHFALGTSGFNDTSLNVGSQLGYPFVDSFGGVWFIGTNQAFCYKQFSSSTPDGTVTLTPPGYGSAALEGIAQDASGAMWFSSWNEGEGVGGYGFATASSTAECQTGSLTYNGASYSGYGSPPWLYATAPQAGSSGIWAGDANSSHLFKVNPVPSPGATPMVDSVNDNPQIDFEGMHTSAGGTVYALTSNYDAQTNNLDTIASNGTVTSIATIPYTYVSAGAFAMTSALRLMYADEDVNGIDLFDQPTAHFLALPLPVAPEIAADSSGYCFGAAFDALDVPWTMCSQSNGSDLAYRLLLTSTWALFPTSAPSIDVRCAYTYNLAVGEALSQSSAPFSMQSSNTAIVNPVGPTTSNPHLLQLTIEPSPGQAVVTVTDKNGRSVNATFTVASDSNGIGCDVRHHRDERTTIPSHVRERLN